MSKPEKHICYGMTMEEGSNFFLFLTMNKSRACFKYIFRKSKSADSTKVEKALPNKLLQHDDMQFWKEIKDLKNDRSCVSTTVNNVTGSKNITDMWKQHFDSLLNSSAVTSKTSRVLNTIKKSDM